MSEKRPSSLFRQKLELLILSQSEEVLNRVKQVVSAHHFTFRHLAYSELPQGPLGDLIKAQLVLVAQDKEESIQDFSARVDEALRLFPRSRIVTVMGTAFSKENLESQNPRITPLSQVEFFSTLKFEYLCLYRCRSQYFEIQVTDLFPMTTMVFPAFIRLELNQRYLAVVYSNTVLSDDRFARLGRAEGLFIQMKDSEKYLQYINNYYDTSGAALKKRARALFLAVCFYSLHLNENILFDFKASGESVAVEAYQNLKKVGEELFTIMRSEENLWDVFREAVDSELSSYWRSPWIATYAALMSIKSGQGDPMTAFLSGLLTDVGLYDLQESVTRKYYLEDDKKTLDEENSYQKHPLLSLNRCLIKKVPLEESVKTVLVCTHERADQKGFPNQVPADKLPVEAQFVLFAEKIDQGVLTTMKQTGVGFRFLKEKIWEAENATPTNFSSAFLAGIAESLI
ncbi:HD domain-containing phosphohydrolase [Bdellovibrio sp. BCCA]|uniref:HD domain-containing phosphohydrolase n=1 Tax=Bdellovibrio sp. BCCA TaxID=3136281 RepID=UPI0030F09D1C